jgi:hypothetical protein
MFYGGSPLREPFLHCLFAVAVWAERDEIALVVGAALEERGGTDDRDETDWLTDVWEFAIR